MMYHFSPVDEHISAQTPFSQLMQKDEPFVLVVDPIRNIVQSFVQATSITPVPATESTRLIYSRMLEGLGMTQLAGILRMSVLPNPYYVTPYEYWDFTRVTSSMSVAVPASVYFRCNMAFQQNIPCDGLVLIEQHTVEPEIHVEQIVRERIVYTPRYYDPILLFMLPFSDDLALPFVAGVWNH
jgi:hypothetical protein